MKYVKKTFTVHTVTSTDPTGKQRVVRSISPGYAKLIESLGHTDITDRVSEMVLMMELSEFRKRSSVAVTNKNNVVVRTLNCYELTVTDKEGKTRDVIANHFEESLKLLLEEAGYQVSYRETVKKFYMTNDDFAEYCLVQNFQPEPVTEPENK